MTSATEPFAVIFDMDGVIIDSNPSITKAWKKFCTGKGIDLSDEQLHKLIFGRTPRDTISALFGNQLQETLVKEYIEENDLLIQKYYKEEGKIVEGLADFVHTLAHNNIPIAIATSAPPGNVEIVLHQSGVKDFFKIILDNTCVHRGKPDPEVYLKTAGALEIAPSRCAVIEDSFSGIEAAKRAGMKVIGVTTTHSESELQERTDLVITDFTGLNPEKIAALFQ